MGKNADEASKYQSTRGSWGCQRLTHGLIATWLQPGVDLEIPIFLA
mgnify:FL=1